MSGANISEKVRCRVFAQAGDRCGYCLAPQHLVLGWHQIEHLNPRSAGGTDDESNLWIACGLCNNYKNDQTDGFDVETSERVRLFNPRHDQWVDHFGWSPDGVRVIGRTPIGRVTVECLRMNNSLAVQVRRHWVGAGWHPPADA